MVRAKEQTAGKGRKDRSWRSPPGNLYFSLCTEQGYLLPLKASLAVAKTLERSGIEPKLKWPNDVLVDNKKICGILTEVFDDRGIVGIGLNVRSAPLEESTCVSDHIDLKRPFDELMGEIISNFYDVDEVIKNYREYSSTVGEQVKIRSVDGEEEGMVRDVDEKGRLVLEDGKKFVSGDVIHLRESPN